MTKRPRPESLHGELQPHPAKAKIGKHTMSSQIDDQTVYAQLDMDVPENALVEDGAIADDATLDKRVKKTLDEDDVSSSALRGVRRYHSSPKRCSIAVSVLAKILLPVIFEDNKDSLVVKFKDTIKHNPWLVKMLMGAYKKGTYSNIRRIGLCGS